MEDGMEYLLGIDVGSSSVKASLLDASSGRCVGSAFYPKTEQKIDAPQPGFAEQDPQCWYDCAKARQCKSRWDCLPDARVGLFG
jgi:xylulokinase